jgi:hypothetical protein
MSAIMTPRTNCQGDSLFRGIAVSVFRDMSLPPDFHKLQLATSASATYHQLSASCLQLALLARTTSRDPKENALLDSWPIKFREEANLYWPKGQHLRTAIQWPAIVSDFERELAPAGAILVTEREIVLISEEKGSPRQVEENFYESGAVITFFPRLRLTDFHVGHHDRFGILALQVHAAHGGEKLEVVGLPDSTLNSPQSLSLEGMTVERCRATLSETLAKRRRRQEWKWRRNLRNPLWCFGSQSVRSRQFPWLRSSG